MNHVRARVRVTQPSLRIVLHICTVAFPGNRQQQAATNLSAEIGSPRELDPFITQFADKETADKARQTGFLYSPSHADSQQPTNDEGGDGNLISSGWIPV